MFLTSSLTVEGQVLHIHPQCSSNSRDATSISAASLLTLEETKQTTLCYTILDSPSLPQGRTLHKSTLTSLSFKAGWVHASTFHILPLSLAARFRDRMTQPILHLQVLSSPLKSPFHWLLSLTMKPLILTVWRQQQTHV